MPRSPDREPDTPRPLPPRSRVAVDLVNDPRHIVIEEEQLPLLGIRHGPEELQEMWQSGEFPVPVQMSPNRIGWILADLHQWIDSRPPVAAPGRSAARQRTRSARR